MRLFPLMQLRMMFVAACAVVAGSPPLLPGAVAQGGRREQPVLAARSLTELRAHDDRVRRRLQRGDLRLRELRADTLIAARTIERADQMHRGVRVFGADVSPQIAGGQTVSVFGTPGGPSYFIVSQEVVTGILLDEQFPYDTATFKSATTARGKESAPGFNVGADVGRLFTRRLRASAMMRFARGSVDFNVDGTHRVSTDAGGAQAGAGIRIAF